MAQEEKKLKELQLKDLCARLAYGIFVKENRIRFDDCPVIYTADFHPFINDCKPYLRPLSSMTEEEKEEYYRFYDLLANENFELYKQIDWLYEHHFDFRGLLEKDLALPAPEGMY